MNKIDTNVLGNSDSQITKVSGQNLKQEHTHISTAVSAAMNLQTLKPNHFLQRFAMNVLVLSVILMTANTNVFASSCNSNQDTDSCPGSGIPGPAGPAGADGDRAGGRCSAAMDGPRAGDPRRVRVRPSRRPGALCRR